MKTFQLAGTTGAWTTALDRAGRWIRSALL